MSINKDKLIRLMYERPVLWNHKHADYRNASLKQHAWIELASEFQMKDEDLKKRWACIRDTFRRELRKILKWSTEAVPYISKWPYFEKMIFLKDTMDARKSFIDEAEEEEVENSAENNIVFEENFTEKLDMKTIKPAEIPFAFGPYTLTQRVISDPLDFENCSKKRNSKEAGLELENEDSSKSRKNVITVEEDEDYHFVMSILPALRKVSNKLKVRMDIMNTIMAAQNNGN
ncbi:uncharacterized protein LOC117171487 [Belonocnema kinseyi]|uniref:uncharacterized protein LOC117171487 n=1 Tax=Belonocnema kinseyi TaxID=2817044 RepID=UPI00143D155A|nr:uncharacterized protein LOC117171487 [Belonocnema kinseyi]